MPSWAKFPMLSGLRLFLLDAVSAYAQPAGTAIGSTPGSAARNHRLTNPGTFGPDTFLSCG